MWSRGCWWCYWCWVNSWCDGSWSPTLILGALPRSVTTNTLHCDAGPMFTSSTVPMGCVMISIKWRNWVLRPGPLALMMIPSPAPHTTPHTIQSNVPLKMYFSTSRRNESVPLGWSILPHNEFRHNQVLVLVRALVCGEFIKSFCASRNGGGGLFANTFSPRYKKQQGVNSTHSAFSQHWRPVCWVFVM